jgi:hypothetical protein
MRTNNRRDLRACPTESFRRGCLSLHCYKRFKYHYVWPLSIYLNSGCKIKQAVPTIETACFFL